MGDLLGIDFLSTEMISFVVFWILLCTVIGLSVKRIPEGGAAIVERLGRYHRTAGSGVNFIFPFVDRVVAVTDMRDQNIRMKPHSVTTLDDVKLEIPVIIRCRVVDARAARYEVDDMPVKIRTTVLADLENIVEDTMLEEVLASGGEISRELTASLRERAARWGVEVYAVEIEEMMKSRR